MRRDLDFYAVARINRLLRWGYLVFDENNNRLLDLYWDGDGDLVGDFENSKFLGVFYTPGMTQEEFDSQFKGWHFTGDWRVL